MKKPQNNHDMRQNNKNYSVSKPILYNYAIQSNINLKNQLKSRKHLKKKFAFMRVNHNVHNCFLNLDTYSKRKLQTHNSNRKLQNLLQKNHQLSYYCLAITNITQSNNIFSIKKNNSFTKIKGFDHKMIKSQNISFVADQLIKFEKYEKDILKAKPTHINLKGCYNLQKGKYKCIDPEIQINEDYKITGWID